MAFYDVRGYPGQVSPLDISSGIDKIGDALTDVLNRRQKAQQFQDQLQFDREDAQRKYAQNERNIGYQNSIIAERDRRDQLAFNQKQEEMKRKATIDASTALANNNPELAKAILHGTVTYDPATGAETGRGELAPQPARDIGPAPEAPLPAGSVGTSGTPVEPTRPAGLPPEIAARLKNRIYKSEGAPMPPAFGVDPTQPPIFTDDGKPPTMEAMGLDPEFHSFVSEDRADTLAAEKAKTEADQYAGAKTAFDAASAAYPAERARYDAERTQAERERPYTIRFGANDEGVQISPEGQRYAGRHAAADDFASSIRGLNLDDRGKANAAAALAALEAGRNKEAVYAAFDRAQATGQKFQDAVALQNQKDAAAKERALIAGPRNPGDFHVGQLHEQQEAGTVRDLKVFEDQFKDWERQAAQLGTESKGYANLERAAKNASAPGGIQQHEGMSALSRYFGGGVAREFEQRFLFQRLAGSQAHVQSVIQNIDNGQFGTEELAAIQAAVRDARAESHERAQGLYESAHETFGPGTGHDYFGGNVDARVRGALKAIGYEAEPMYPGVAPVQLGDIVRPYRSQLHGRGQAPPPAPEPRPAGPPEVGAARARGKTKSLDDAMQ